MFSHENASLALRDETFTKKAADQRLCSPRTAVALKYVYKRDQM